MVRNISQNRKLGKKKETANTFFLPSAPTSDGTATANLETRGLAKDKDFKEGGFIAPFGVLLTEKNTPTVTTLPYGDSSNFKADFSSTSPNYNAPSRLLGKRTNLCGHSDFENKTSPGSPWINDCLQLAWNIRGNGDWALNAFGWRVIASYGTCAFGGQATGYDLTNVRIGNEDVIDLINSSIQLFAWDGKVGSRGRTTCGRNSIEWGVHHT